jgi:hypothetical protein
MALKTWLLKKIEKQEQGLKFLKALLIMLTHVENAGSDSDTDSNNSLNVDDIELADDDDDDDD